MLFGGGGLYREKKFLHGQHGLRIRYPRVSGDGLQSRAGERLFVGASSTTKMYLGMSYQTGGFRG